MYYIGKTGTIKKFLAPQNIPSLFAINFVPLSSVVISVGHKDSA